LSFPGVPENWDPNDERARGLINEWLLHVQGALARERERVDEIVANSGIVKPAPFVGHPGQPTLGTCADDADVGGVAVFAQFVTHANRGAGEAFAGTLQAMTYDNEIQDDDGMFTPTDSVFYVQGVGDVFIEGQVDFGPTTAGTVALTILVNGQNKGQTVQAGNGGGANQILVNANVSGLGPGDLITCAFSHDQGSVVSAAGGLKVTRTSEASPVEPQSYCLSVNFGGTPGHAQVRRDTFPLLAYQLLTHWDEWQDRGNGDVYLALASDAHAGTPGDLDLVFTVGIPRGFTGWATNAIVLRYRLSLAGLAGATTVAATLTVIDTRNDAERFPTGKS